MADSSFRIAVDLSELIPAGSPLGRDAFPTLSYAVRSIAEAAREQWVAYASGAPLPGGKSIRSRTGEYARSIQLEQRGDFAAEVYSVLPYAGIIEEGSASYDMKRILGSSWKVRATKDGRRYLIIPFRWNHPNSVLGNNMPQVVHDWWQDPGRTASSITGTYRRVSGALGSDIQTRGPMTVPGRRYHWGDRLSKDTLAGLGVSVPQAKRMAGMVNFRKPGGEGQGAHSQFITFRTMMEGSKGWIAPAREGLWPARTTADQFRPVAEEAFAKAVEEDVRRALGAGT